MLKSDQSMSGKRGLIMGVANERSIAWGIAQVLAQSGAELAFTFQGEAFEKRLEPLAKGVNSNIILPCDVEKQDSINSVFSTIQQDWGSIDFVVHSLAYSDKHELSGRYVDTTAKNFSRTLDISCFSFTAVAKAAYPLMLDNGGSMITLTYYGAERVLPNYNVMGVAKAALEASVRYLATDLGPDKIRVNGLSAGPMRTLAGSAIGSARKIYNLSELNSPLRKSVTLDQIGNTALYLLSDASSGVTGEIHHVDSGYNIIGMPYL
ncbi:MAG: enoyl-ACP reductase [Rhodospirillales bacterium]|nr:MAG: enoyl-ACP reductase [Rhodospirillaceae bacterium TMED23]|tara:strand:+ start:297 stop:1088 length:792 start_codon:yes stop_codon:yes gene_type:complete